jgi:hypothetical protein
MKIVCRVLFLNILGISEKKVRSVLSNVTEAGTIPKERRGGRSKLQKESDEQKMTAVQCHINRFPRMESHYCRASSSCEYLSPQLNLTKIFNMYCQEDNPKVSFSFYQKVFSTMNLKFHVPKKDLCGLCDTYRSANGIAKLELQEKYESHIAEKQEVRKIK